MWRPDVWPWSRPDPYLLRLGQAHVQLWQAQGKGWAAIGSLPSHHLAHDQHEALAALLLEAIQALPPGAKVQVVVDSKWMPVSLLLTGTRPLSRDQVQALARHRFVQTFGELASTWATQTDYVAGDLHALAFACPVGLQALLRRTLEDRLDGLQPTLSWAWRRAWAGHKGRGDAWLVLAEHDRSVLLKVSQGKACALQPAAPMVRSPSQVVEVLRTEAWRCGVVDDTLVVRGASFEPSPAWTSVPATDEFHWQVFGAREPTP